MKISSTRRQQGMVLATVMVLLFIMSILVVTQIQRSILDARLTINSRNYTSAVTAAQSVLRWCEAWALTGGESQTGGLAAVFVPQPRDSEPNQRPAWQQVDWDDEDNSIIRTGAPGVPDFPGIQNYGCLYEDATAELFPSRTTQDVSLETGKGGQGGALPLIRKYRITVRVRTEAGETLFLQSELRFSI